MKCSKMFTPKRSAAVAEKILKNQECSAHCDHDWQMAPAERTEALSLNAEIADSITKTEVENHKRLGNNVHRDLPIVARAGEVIERASGQRQAVGE